MTHIVVSMCGHVHDCGVGLKDVLGAVPVMDVPVHDQHSTGARRLGGSGSNGGVIEVTEPDDDVVVVVFMGGGVLSIEQSQPPRHNIRLLLPYKVSSPHSSARLSVVARRSDNGGAVTSLALDQQP